MYVDICTRIHILLHHMLKVKGVGLRREEIEEEGERREREREEEEEEGGGQHHTNRSYM